MNQHPSHKSAFLRPATSLPRQPRRTVKSACPRAVNNPQRSAKVHLNQIVEGVVTRVTSFGAFVDVGNGQTGLVHISEIADTFVQDINQHVSVGERLAVRVVSIDSEKNRIGLSIKQVAPKASGYDRVIELGGDWGHPWGDDGKTKFMDLGPRPEPSPHHWEPDPSLFEKWRLFKEQQ